MHLKVERYKDNWYISSSVTFIRLLLLSNVLYLVIKISVNYFLNTSVKLLYQLGFFIRRMPLSGLPFLGFIVSYCRFSSSPRHEGREAWLEGALGSDQLVTSEKKRDSPPLSVYKYLGRSWLVLCHACLWREEEWRLCLGSTFPIRSPWVAFEVKQ